MEALQERLVKMETILGGNQEQMKQVCEQMKKMQEAHHRLQLEIIGKMGGLKDELVKAVKQDVWKLHDEHAKAEKDREQRTKELIDRIDKTLKSQDQRIDVLEKHLYKMLGIGAVILTIITLGLKFIKL